MFDRRALRHGQQICDPLSGGEEGGGDDNVLDVLVVFAELLVVEAELIHKVGGHLLDLVVGERLGAVVTAAHLQNNINATQPLPAPSPERPWCGLQP